MITKDNRGFTLVELLVVIAIIGLLSTLAVVALQGARVKSRDAKRVADIKQVQTALELFASERGIYPATAGADADGDGFELGSELTALRFNPADQVNQWNVAAGAGIKTLLGQAPADPRGGTAAAAPGCAAGSVAVCNYTYAQPAGQTQQYTMFLFLEEKTGNLNAGVHCATEAGISADANCSH